MPLDLLPPLLEGTGVTLLVWTLSALLAAAMTLVAGLGRIAPLKPVRWLSIAYIELFRGTSALVQLYWIYYALPIATGIRLSPLLAGVITLGLHVGGYGAEVFRGAMRAVPRGQREAAQALGLKPATTTWLILIPQALVSMLPPFGNLLIELLKLTPLVYFIELTDLTFQGQLLRANTLRTGEIFTLLLILYFIIAFAISMAMKTLEKKVSHGMRSGN